MKAPTPNQKQYWYSLSCLNNISRTWGKLQGDWKMKHFRDMFRQILHLPVSELPIAYTHSKE